MSFSASSETRDLAALEQRVASLRARHEMRALRLAQLTEMVGQAKARVARQPKAQEFLERLQERCHQKSVGIYEELLTAVVQDVLPGEKSVALTLKTARGLPSLDIEMVKSEGERESILEGSGGALTNILSAGLRVIALARSGAYPFLVLDEPDCWLKPSRVPQFANVLGQIAQDLQIQVLLISHHDADSFAQFSSQVRLERRGGLLEAKWAGPVDPGAWDGARSGIKELRLFDFMSHARTVIPLAPGVTCLTGENDIGKSAIVSGLRALFYGSGSDSAIAHGKSQFKVEAEFFDGAVLSVERYLKKSPKQRWRYHVAGQSEPVQDSSTKDGAPEWIDHVARIARTEELDIAFANQKSPVFLLDQPPSRRASILAVGRESAHLQRLISKNKERSLLDGKLIRDGESEGAAIQRELAELDALDGFADRLLSLRRDAAATEESSREAAALELRLARGLALRETLAASVALGAHAGLSAPRLLPVDELDRRLAQLATAKSRCALSPPTALSARPDILPLDGLARSLVALGRARAVASQAAPLSPPQMGPLLETDKLAFSMERLARAQSVAQLSSPQALGDPPSLSSVERLREMGSRLSRLKKVIAAVEGRASLLAPAEPRLAAVDRLGGALEKATALAASLSELPARAAEVAERSADAQRLTALLFDAVGGVCPTCNEPLGRGHEMEASHD